MPLIASRLGHKDHLRAWLFAKLGAIGIAQDIEFAHGLDPQQILAGTTGLHVVVSGTGELRAVEQKQILLGGCPRLRNCRP